MHLEKHLLGELVVGVSSTVARLTIGRRSHLVRILEGSEPVAKGSTLKLAVLPSLESSAPAPLAGVELRASVLDTQQLEPGRQQARCEFVRLTPRATTVSNRS